MKKGKNLLSGYLQYLSRKLFTFDFSPLWNIRGKITWGHNLQGCRGTPLKAFRTPRRKFIIPQTWNRARNEILTRKYLIKKRRKRIKTEFKHFTQKVFQIYYKKIFTITSSSSQIFGRWQNRKMYTQKKNVYALGSRSGIWTHDLWIDDHQRWGRTQPTNPPEMAKMLWLDGSVLQYQS